jgi:hypothetical protein
MAAGDKGTFGRDFKHPELDHAHEARDGQAPRLLASTPRVHAGIVFIHRDSKMTKPPADLAIAYVMAGDNGVVRTHIFRAGEAYTYEGFPDSWIEQ